MITINELHSKTGLKITFIRKCVKELNEILEPHIQRGNYNSINFSPNAFVIFDKIKQLKDEGLIITDIKRRLEKELKDDKSGESKELKVHQTPLNPSKDDKSQAIETLGNQILDLQEQLVREKEKTFQERESKLKELNEHLRKISELEQRNLILQLTLKLLPEGKDPETIKREWEEDQKKQLERKEILEKLEELEGKWFKAKERKELLAKLKELS